MSLHICSVGFVCSPQFEKMILRNIFLSVLGSVFVLPALANEANPMLGIPTVIDVGSKYCIPCKMMVPVLANVKSPMKDELKFDL